MTTKRTYRRGDAARTKRITINLSAAEIAAIHDAGFFVARNASAQRRPP